MMSTSLFAAHRKTSKECVFCAARGKLTEEHVVAQWLAPEIPKSAKSAHKSSLHTAIIDKDTGTILNENGKSRVGDLGNGVVTRNRTLKIVCERCNSGWMSRLQDQAKPILSLLLKGEWPSAISEWDRRVVSAWATMFTMVVEYADLETQSTTFQERDRLRLYLEPPPGWYIWVASFSGVLWTSGHYNHFGWTIREMKVADDRVRTAPDLVSGLKDSQSTAWVIGRLFFQTFSSKAKNYDVDPENFSSPHGLSTWWPPRSPIISPKNVLDDVAADNASAGLLPVYAERRRAWET